MKLNLSTVPPIDREEWKKMITGEIIHQYKNYTLQVMLTKLRKQVNEKEITIDDAVKQIHDLSLKYILAVQIDFKQIFKNW